MRDIRQHGSGAQNTDHAEMLPISDYGEDPQIHDGKAQAGTWCDRRHLGDGASFGEDNRLDLMTSVQTHSNQGDVWQATALSLFAQSDYQSGHSPTWYVIVGLIMLIPLIGFVMILIISSSRNARTQAIIEAIQKHRRNTVFELANRLGTSDPERLWKELQKLSHSGLLPKYTLDEPGRFIELRLPPDPWNCSSCGAENDGRNGLLSCESCERPRDPRH